MPAISETKSPAQNRLEGFALSAVLLGFPTYAVAVLVIKLMGAHEIVGSPGGPVIFVVLALFYDARLSVADKIAQWRVQPAASVQLVSNVLLLSLLAVGVVSIR